MKTDWPWQPTLIGTWIRLRPLTEEDFEPLYLVATDPLIWEQHPERERYKREIFMENYFRFGMESKGAFVIIDQKTGQIMGGSRFTRYEPSTPSIEIGYTFLARKYWGKGHNRELKFLMLNYAFQFVDTVDFYVGETNYRSQKAVLKIGVVEVKRISTTASNGRVRTSVIYRMKKADWPTQLSALMPPFEQIALATDRLFLEPVQENDAEELWELFRDSELHQFVPFEPVSLEKQRERCAKWAKRRSPDLNEVWLNWAARDKETSKIIAHFQAGILQNGVASIAYLVARDFQSKGIATEGIQAVFTYLRDGLGVREVKAWSDSRNVASHRLAEKLGMVQVEFIKNADFFNGATSDEFVFSRVFKS